MHMFLSCPSPRIAKQQFVSRSKRLNFLSLRNPVELSGNFKCPASAENLALCCYLWVVGLQQAAVLVLLWMWAGYPRNMNRTSSHLGKEWGNVGIYSIKDLSIVCWYYLIKRERHMTGLLFNCSTVEIQDNCQGFHQIANDWGGMETRR